MSEWQSIDSAPLDRMILGCDPASYLYAIVVSVNGEWMCVDYRGMGMDIGFYPTHWHSLPEPPTAHHYATPSPVE